MTAKKRRKPNGSRWRILVHDRRGNVSHDISSNDMEPAPGGKRTIFDEFVMYMGDEAIHIEQMDTDTWFVAFGEEKRMVWVGRDGKIKVGEVYR